MKTQSTLEPAMERWICAKSWNDRPTETCRRGRGRVAPADEGKRPPLLLLFFFCLSETKLNRNETRNNNPRHGKKEKGKAGRDATDATLNRSLSFNAFHTQQSR